MIKKLLCVLFCFTVCVFTCSCTGYKEMENSFIVTMLGYDFDKEYIAFAEVVTSNNKNENDMPVAAVYKGNGKTPESALYSLKSKLSKTLMFNHCSAVITGESVVGSKIKKVFEFCEEMHELNLSVYMLSCVSAENIFTDSSPISMARGYDIAGLITEMKESSGVNVLNRFYECNKYLKDGEYFTLPIIKAEESKIEVIGNNVYKDGFVKERLTVDEGLIYSVLTGKNPGGVFLIDNARAKIHISKIKTSKKKESITLYINFSNEKEDFLSKFRNKSLALVKEKGGNIGLNYKAVNIKRMKAK